MAKDKVTVDLEIERDHAEWLKENAERFGLEDESKALRVLMDYAIRDVDDELIFSPRNKRCRHCT